ncbi:MAG: hypothetical protein IPJ45_00760 [Ignavibacteria bacterium]|nr:hypothetical protein [Ignavibacteria bacterium]
MKKFSNHFALYHILKASLVDSDYVSEKLSKIKSRLNNIQFDNNEFIRDLKLAIALWVDDNGVMAFAHR